MIEQFDVVDLNGHNTGVLTTKPVSHKDGSPHRVAAVFVFQNGKLLLQVHQGSGGQLDHTVGGHVSAGEDYETAATREMEEEIGLKSSIKLIKTDVLSDERFGNFQVVHMFGIFEAQAPDDWIFVPNDEVKELVPMHIEQIITEMNRHPDKFTRGFINTLEAYLQVKNHPLRINKKELLSGRKGV